ncbi:MAG TPA: PKD domain-containing protein [Solirubrobacterales bacterium]
MIAPASTIDGPSTEIIGLGGVAMAGDGTGGLVYAKSVGGIPHIFASRYAGGQWEPPVRVDWGIRYPASQPVIAAGVGGRLMVVWVTQVATLPSGEIRDGLYSATLDPGTAEFGPALLVDPNVGTGSGVDPSLAGTAAGKAIVAYRVVTNTFSLPTASSAAQLRPGDVLADIRVARLEGDRWSRLGAINRNPGVSMRPPTETNGPKVAIDATGRAVVAWIEPDQTKVARTYMRRIDGTTLGPVLVASPETWEGSPVLGDVTAVAVAVTATDRAHVASRVEGTTSSATGGGRIFLANLASSTSPDGGKPSGPTQLEVGSSTAPLGPPALAAADGQAAEGSMVLAYSAGATARTAGLDLQGAVSAPTSPAGPAANLESPIAAIADVEGGGTIAYATTAEGAPGVVVRQEIPGGGTQTATLFGPIGGSVSQLFGAGVESGDGLLGFSQGEGGRLAIIGDRIAAPPGRFAVRVPQKWVRPGQAVIRWSAPPTGVGGLTYDLLVGGSAVVSGVTSRQMTPRRSVLGSGVNRVQVMATDSLGGDVVSKPVKLRVDDQPPRLRAKVKAKSGTLELHLEDSQSGLKPSATRISFGDGRRARNGGRFRHRYERPGRYLVRVRASDRVHNRLVQQFWVAVR